LLRKVIDLIVIVWVDVSGSGSSSSIGRIMSFFSASIVIFFCFRNGILRTISKFANGTTSRSAGSFDIHFFIGR